MDFETVRPVTSHYVLKNPADRDIIQRSRIRRIRSAVRVL